MATFILDDVRAVCKKRDAWWTVFLVDPLAVRLTLLVANRTSITPDRLTVGAFLLGLGAACCFVVAEPWALLTGAVLYHFSFVLDCMDGKIARLKGTGTFFGAWLDYMLDRLRVLACGVGLVAGQFSSTGDVRFLFLGFVILFMDMFRYANALHVAKTRMAMGMAVAEHQGVRGACGVLGADEDDAVGRAADPDVDADADAGGAGERPAGPVSPDGGRLGFRARYPLYGALCMFLLRHRVRVHLFSGVEFQMFVFIIAPVLAALAGHWVTIPVTAGAGLLLGVFELLVIYRLWVSASNAERILGHSAEPLSPAPVPLPRTMTVVGER